MSKVNKNPCPVPSGTVGSYYRKAGRESRALFYPHSLVFHWVNCYTDQTNGFGLEAPEMAPLTFLTYLARA